MIIQNCQGKHYPRIRLLQRAQLSTTSPILTDLIYIYKYIINKNFILGEVRARGPSLLLTQYILHLTFSSILTLITSVSALNISDVLLTDVEDSPDWQTEEKTRSQTGAMHFPIFRCIQVENRTSVSLEPFSSIFISDTVYCVISINILADLLFSYLGYSLLFTPPSS